MTIQWIYHHLVPSVIKRLIDPSSEKEAAFVRRAAGAIQRHGKVLDAGAGECRYRNVFGDHHYTAVDFGKGDARWNYSGLDATARLEHLPFKEEQFDGVVCIQVLEHVNEPLMVLEELYRVTKRGGLLFITAPQGWGIHQAPNDYFRFTSYGLTYLLEKAGFEVVSLEPVCGYFGYLANRLTVFPKTVFWPIRKKSLRLLFSPLECISYGLFVFLLPVVLNLMDGLDRDKRFTLNYFAVARKINE